MPDTTSTELPSAAGEGPLSYAIFQLAGVHRGHAAGMLRAMNLHPGQELLPMQLFDHAGRTQAELLEQAGLDHSTVSKSLRRMQEAGLLTREPASHDRRVMVVHLTDAGRAPKEPIADMWRTLEQVSCATWPLTRSRHSPCARASSKCRSGTTADSHLTSKRVSRAG